jgi:hypothetical protein
MSLLGDGGDLKGAIDKCASPLRNHEFSSLQPHPNTSGAAPDPLINQAIFVADPLESALVVNTFYFSGLGVSLNVEATGQAIPPSSGTKATGPSDSFSILCSLRVKRINCCSPSGPTGTSRRPPTFNC